MGLRNNRIEEVAVSAAGGEVRFKVREPRPQDMKLYFAAQGPDWDVYSARVELGAALVEDVREGDIEYQTEEGWRPLTARVEGFKERLKKEHFPLLAAVGYVFERTLLPLPAEQGRADFFSQGSCLSGTGE